MAPSALSPNERLMRKRLNARLRQRRCRQRKREAAAKKKLDDDQRKIASGEELPELHGDHHAGHHLNEDVTKLDELKKHEMNHGTAFSSWPPSGRGPYAMAPPQGSRRSGPPQQQQHSVYPSNGAYAPPHGAPHGYSAQMMPVFVPYHAYHPHQQQYHPQYGAPQQQYAYAAPPKQASTGYNMECPPPVYHYHHHPPPPPPPPPAPTYPGYSNTTEAVPRTVSRSPSDGSMASSKAALACSTNKDSFTPICAKAERRELGLSATLEDTIKEVEEEQDDDEEEEVIKQETPEKPSTPLMSTEKTAVVAMLALGSDESSDDGDSSTIQSV